MTYTVEIIETNGGVEVVVGDNPILHFDTMEGAEAFVDGLFYEGYPREDLVRA